MNEFIIKDLDDFWIKDFELSENEYKHFYKEDITFVKLNFIYINNDNCIEKMKEENYFFKLNNFLSREEILTIIKKNNIENNIHYSLLSILKYNINIDPIHLKNFFKNKSNFLTSIKNIDSITFQPTISLFHDLNNIFILFYPKLNSSHTITKKIFIKNSNKTKTIRNTFKEIK